MTLELKNVVKRVGAQTHIQKRASNWRSGLQCPSRHDPCRQNHADAADGRARAPTSGEIWFNGKNVTGVPVQKRNVSMVYQQFINYPNFTVFENIASPLRVARMKRPDIQNRVHHMAEVLRLTPMLGALPRRTVGGQQQRTALARALSGTRSSYCSTNLSPISTSSLGKSFATNFQNSLQAGIAPSYSPPPIRWKRCSSADTPPRFTRAASRSSDRPYALSLRPVDPDLCVQLADALVARHQPAKAIFLLPACADDATG